MVGSLEISGPIKDEQYQLAAVIPVSRSHWPMVTLKLHFSQ